MMNCRIIDKGECAIYYQKINGTGIEITGRARDTYNFIRQAGIRNFRSGHDVWKPSDLPARMAPVRLRGNGFHLSLSETEAKEWIIASHPLLPYSGNLLYCSSALSTKAS
jgi:hypothetical protein